MNETTIWHTWEGEGERLALLHTTNLLPRKSAQLSLEFLQQWAGHNLTRYS